MNAQRDAQRASAAGSGRFDFRLLGPLEAIVEGGQVELGSPKQRALLAHLLLHPNEAVPVERLVDELWPDDPPASARHAVQVYVSRLRRALGDATRIEARSRAYLLRAEPDEVDFARFRGLVAEGREALAKDDPASAAALLAQALSLWRARALADLDGEPGVRDLVLELEEERLQALELRLDAELRAGRTAELVPELERLIGEHPARETFYAQLMLALYRAGRQAEALEAYRRARQSLLNELGLEPSRQLKELEAAILRQDPALTPEPEEIRARRHLPAQPNAFIGRERELEEVVNLVASGGIRLVTLTGPGGIGKTRLGLAAADRLAASFTDGVWFVDLAPLSDAALVPSAIAQTLGVKDKPGQTTDTTLAEYLRERELLLLVDNFEHLLEAATVLSGVLKAAPRLKLLVTSRSPLHLYGEHVYEVPSLELPAPAASDIGTIERCESVALFLARARAVRRTFAITHTNAAVVCELCIMLEGSPLALELAASRLHILSLGHLCEQLSRRLETLIGGPRDVPARQRTLEAAIDWSHDLLDEDAKRMFERLSVFAGDFSLEAADAICQAEVGTLAALADLSLLKPIGNDRFLMLDTIREYAAERLGDAREADQRRRKHAEWFSELAASLRDDVRNARREPTARLQKEHDNIRSALAWLLGGGDDVRAADLIWSLFSFWLAQGFLREGYMWARRAFPQDTLTPERVWGAMGASELARCCGDLEFSTRLKEAAIDVLRPMGEERWIAALLSDLSDIAGLQGDLDRARLLSERALATRRRLGDPDGIAHALYCQAAVEFRAGKFADARQVYAESKAASLEYPLTVARCEFMIGECARRLGEFAEARELFRRSLRPLADVEPFILPELLQELGAFSRAQGDPVRATRLLGASERLLNEVGGLRWDPQDYESNLASVREALSDGRFDAEWSTGLRMTADQAIQFAAEVLG